MCVSLIMCVWHDSLCVCDMTHYVCVTWHITWHPPGIHGFWRMMSCITSHTHTQILTHLCGCHDLFVCRHTAGRVHRRPCGNAQQNPQLDRTEIFIKINTQICKIVRSRLSSACSVSWFPQCLFSNPHTKTAICLCWTKEHSVLH